MPFVKLDCNILESSLWIDHDARTLFVTALLMARPFTLDAPTPGIAVKSLDALGFTVPAGEYGFVAAAGTGIIHRAGLAKGVGLEALERLCAPESDSRTPDHEGRRMIRIDGGYILLNYCKYRNMDRTNAERQARFRASKKPAEPPPESNGSNGVTSLLSNASRSRSRSNNISDRDKSLSSPAPQAAAGRIVKGSKVVELFHAKCPTLPHVQTLTPTRRKAIANRAKHAGGDPLAWFGKLFDAAHASDFLSGRNGKTSVCSFDWLLKPSNAQKTLEGNYANDRNARASEADTGTANRYDGWTEPTA